MPIVSSVPRAYRPRSASVTGGRKKSKRKSSNTSQTKKSPKKRSKRK
jgi:hypothetical protein